MKKIFLLISLILIVATLFPSLNLLLIDDSHEHLSIIHGDGFFGRDLSFLHPPLIFYFKHYGIQFASLVVAFKLFYFNSKMYFILALVLRIFAAFSIYYFVSKWTKSIVAGIISAFFFATCTATLQNITRVTIFQIYLAIVFLCIFLDRWFTFQHYPNRKNLLLSASFFVIAILSHPIRMAGLIFLVLGGETYWLFKNGFDKFFKKRLIHLVLLLFCIYVLIFVIGSVNSTDELSAKMISPKILLVSLLTGSPPLMTSLFLFIANLVISPFTFAYGYLNASTIKGVIIFLPLLAFIFLIICLKRRRFLLALFSSTAIAFPYFVNLSSPHLTDWQPEWVLVTQLGGTIFILLNILLLLFWSQNKMLAQIGLLGSAIVISNLLLPWMVTPQASLLDQSPFLFIHRYYTIPSIGLGMLLASIFILSIQSIKFKSGINYLRLAIPLTIVLLILLQVITTNLFLVKETQGIDSAKTDLLWSKLRYYSNDLARNPSYVYLEYEDSLNEAYIKKLFPRRVEIELARSITPNINFIFSKDEILELLKNDPDYLQKNSFFAFKFDGKNLYDIKQDILKPFNK